MGFSLLKLSKRLDYGILVLLASTLILLFSKSFTLHSPEVHHLVFYLLLPMALILLLGKNIKQYFAFDKKAFFCREFWVFLAVFAVAVIAAAFLPEFQAYYAAMGFRSVQAPLAFLASSVLLIFCWEFFFRSFMIFGLAEKFGTSAIFIQAVPFAFMHLGKPVLEVYASFFAGIILAYLALKQKSFYGAFILHLMVYSSIGLISMGFSGGL